MPKPPSPLDLPKMVWNETLKPMLSEAYAGQRALRDKYPAADFAASMIPVTSIPAGVDNLQMHTRAGQYGAAALDVAGMVPGVKLAMRAPGFLEKAVPNALRNVRFNGLTQAPLQRQLLADGQSMVNDYTAMYGPKGR